MDGPLGVFWQVVMAWASLLFIMAKIAKPVQQYFSGDAIFSGCAVTVCNSNS
jgi:hypothetical protein